MNFRVGIINSERVLAVNDCMLVVCCVYLHVDVS